MKYLLSWSQTQLFFVFIFCTFLSFANISVKKSIINARHVRQERPSQDAIAYILRDYPDFNTRGDIYNVVGLSS